MAGLPFPTVLGRHPCAPYSSRLASVSECDLVPLGWLSVIEIFTYCSVISARTSKSQFRSTRSSRTSRSQTMLTVMVG